MNRIVKLAIILVILILPLSRVEAQNTIDGRSLALAGSNIATAEGLEYLGGNPATLAGRKDFGFEFLLLSARLKLSNNTFSLEQYDDYFTTGDMLTDRDIDNLLGDLGEDGLRLDGLVGVKALSFCARSFGFGLTGVGNGYVIVPEEAVKFPFYGNREIKDLSFEDLEGDSWGGVALNLGYAGKFTRGKGNTSSFFSAGINLKYILGLAYGGLIDADGGLQTTDEYILADGQMSYRTSRGGRGVAADLGFLAQFGTRWALSLHCNNLMGKIGW
ncbi:hypothetical protein J7M07_03070, partial [bacterium]|nr:hypothetical protein [bacterium]